MKSSAWNTKRWSNGAELGAILAKVDVYDVLLKGNIAIYCATCTPHNATT